MRQVYDEKHLTHKIPVKPTCNGSDIHGILARRPLFSKRSMTIGGRTKTEYGVYKQDRKFSVVQMLNFTTYSFQGHTFQYEKSRPELWRI